MRAVRVEREGIRYAGLEEDGAFRVDPAPDLEPIDIIAAEGWEALDRRATERIDASAARILAPVSRPGKILCVGLNYSDHAEEEGLEPPDHPILFAKMPTAIIGPGDPIPLHDITSQLDYEVELALVVGSRVRGVTRQDTLGTIAGYTVLNDVSARDIQFGDGQWMRGKSLDGYAPMGPALVSPDEVGDPGNLNVQTLVNGELRQASNTRRLIFDIPYLIEFCAQAMTLDPGDVISTGTPGGVGIFMDPPQFLQDGDQVAVSVEKVGELRNPVAKVELEHLKL